MRDGTERELLTFNQTSAKDVVEKLRREIERIESPAEREFAGDHVLNAFWTAWHLLECVWHAIKDQAGLKAAVLKYRGIDEGNIDDQRAFGLALAARFLPLKLCRMIVTSPKQVHVVLGVRRPNGDLSAFGFYVVGANSNGGDDHSSAGMIPMIIIMGKPVVATRLLNEIADYWVTLIEECGIEQHQ